MIYHNLNKYQNEIIIHFLFPSELAFLYNEIPILKVSDKSFKLIFGQYEVAIKLFVVSASEKQIIVKDTDRNMFVCEDCISKPIDLMQMTEYINGKIDTVVYFCGHKTGSIINSIDIELSLSESSSQSSFFDEG